MVALGFLEIVWRSILNQLWFRATQVDPTYIKFRWRALADQQETLEGWLASAAVLRVDVRCPQERAPTSDADVMSHTIILHFNARFSASIFSVKFSDLQKIPKTSGLKRTEMLYFLTRLLLWKTTKCSNLHQQNTLSSIICIEKQLFQK